MPVLVRCAPAWARPPADRRDVASPRPPPGPLAVCRCHGLPLAVPVRPRAGVTVPAPCTSCCYILSESESGESPSSELLARVRATVRRQWASAPRRHGQVRV